MNNLKQRIFVLTALGGTILCVNVENAHAARKLSASEMQATIGGQAPTTGPTTKVGQWCGTTNSKGCAYVAPNAAVNGCVETSAMPFPDCTTVGVGEAGNPSTCYLWNNNGCKDVTYKTSITTAGTICATKVIVSTIVYGGYYGCH